MNHHSPHQSAAEPAGALFNSDDARMRSDQLSLALQLRRNGHQQRAWSREAAAKGQTVAAETFAKRADRYAADALWYIRRSRNT